MGEDVKLSVSRAPQRDAIAAEGARLTLSNPKKSAHIPGLWRLSRLLVSVAYVPGSIHTWLIKLSGLAAIEQCHAITPKGVSAHKTESQGPARCRELSLYRGKTLWCGSAPRGGQVGRAAGPTRITDEGSSLNVARLRALKVMVIRVSEPERRGLVPRLTKVG